MLAFLLVGVAVAVCTLVALPSGEIEPTYEGRRLSDVLSEPPPRDDGLALVQRQRIAEGLFLHMGTNAMPYLVKLACPPTPEWRIALAQFCLSHPRIFPDALTRRLTKTDHLEYRAMETASDLWKHFGTNANPVAILQLVHIANDTQSVRRAKRAADCLDCFKAAANALASDRNAYIVRRALSDTNPVVRQAAAFALTNSGLTWP